MKGELEMEFVDVVDVKQGLAMYRVKESFLKQIFLSLLSLEFDF